MSLPLDLISVLLGWAYVVCWGVSLYPPVLLHRRMKSVEGMSIDFAFLNFFGCLAYMLSVGMLRYSTTVRLEYQLRHKNPPLVRFNDVVYGVHSLVLVAAVLFQFYCSGYRRSSGQHISRGVKVFSLVMVMAGCALLLHAWEISTTRRHYELVDVANIFGTVKIWLSAVKYIPQVLYNYKRKSTRGFSKTTPILDVLGAYFSVAQLALDAYLAGDITDMYKHPVKLLLSIVTLVFSLAFLIQHSIYRERTIPFHHEKNYEAEI
ncbi:Cystinosin [Wickerhamiella sorbophila]|uniref:Cystinosin n=1 Tax=Wickerhamiella sorbophila TaxID=45607 RepID=A0A2T0FG63_9ASCO|nr:Cystinosin [Wickerhamiella sorbophila]PRT53992.1 Cystinosin [Wickerhamiella sorbophila]